MKLEIKIQPENNPEGISLDFDVPVPDKYVNILKESGRIISAVTQAIQNIKDELRED